MEREMKPVRAENTRYLPDSLLYIYAATLDNYGVKLHCREGTEIQKSLAAQGIEWVRIEE